MKNSKENISKIIGIACMVITAVVNLVGYFRLPDKVASQIGLTGKLDNTVPKLNYLLLSSIIVVFLSVMCFSKEKNQKIKYIIVDLIVVIANIAMIAIQI